MGDAVGEHVLFLPELLHPEVVHHVLGVHVQVDRRVDRHHQGVRPGRVLAAPATARRRGTGGSPAVPRHTILSSPGRPADEYDVDAAFMQLELRGRGIHAL